MKRTRIVLTLAMFAPIAIAAQGPGWHAKPEAIAQAAKAQPGFNYDESRVEPYTLPDPLVYQGAKVASALKWPPRYAPVGTVANPVEVVLEVRYCSKLTKKKVLFLPSYTFGSQTGPPTVKP